MVDTRSHLPRWMGKQGRSVADPVEVSDEEASSSRRWQGSISMMWGSSSKTPKAPRRRHAVAHPPHPWLSAKELHVVLSRIWRSVPFLPSSEVAEALPGTAEAMSSTSAAPMVATVVGGGREEGIRAEMGELPLARHWPSSGSAWAARARVWLVHLDEAEDGTVGVDCDDSRRRTRKHLTTSGKGLGRHHHQSDGTKGPVSSSTPTPPSESAVGGMLAGATAFGVEEEGGILAMAEESPDVCRGFVWTG